MDKKKKDWREKPVKLISINGFEAKFDSCKEAADWLNADPAGISKVLNGTNKTVHGWRVEYA